MRLSCTWATVMDVRLQFLKDDEELEAHGICRVAEVLLNGGNHTISESPAKSSEVPLEVLVSVRDQMQLK